MVTALVCFIMAVLLYAIFHAGALANWLTIAGIMFGVIVALRDRWERESVWRR